MEQKKEVRIDGIVYVPKSSVSTDDIGTMNKKAFILKQERAGKKPLKERNAVYSPLGLHVFNCAFKTRQERLI